MNLALRTLACGAALLACTLTPAEGQARDHGARIAVHATAHHGGYHGGHFAGRGWAVRGGGHRWRGGGWGPGVFIGGLGLGLGIAALSGYPASPYYPVPVYPTVVIEPAYPGYHPVPAAPAAAPPVTAPDPIIYPRNGQSAEQTEADRQACNRWATTQPKAMADASVFQRATLACMDGRGYTLR